MIPMYKNQLKETLKLLMETGGGGGEERKESKKNHNSCKINVKIIKTDKYFYFKIYNTSQFTEWKYQ